MTQPFNGLTPAEAERLAILAEECAEVIVEVNKILRHGYESWHPDEPSQTNRQRLRKELIQVAAVHEAMFDNGDVENHGFSDIREAWRKKRRFTHHQEDAA